MTAAQAGKNAVENNALSRDEEKKLGLRPVKPISINPLMESIGVLNPDGEVEPPKGGAKVGGKGNSRALSSLEGAKLKGYYRQAEKYGQAGVKELENGNYRFTERQHLPGP